MALSILRLACLVVAILTLQFYVFYGAYSKSHRLLPVLLTCVCLYCFYEMVLNVTGAKEVFFLLERLLLVEVLYIILYYIYDFSHARQPYYVDIIGFISLILGNVFTLLQYYSQKPIYSVLYYTFVLGYGFLILLISAFFSIKRRIKSRRERYTIGMIYLAFLIPSLSVPFRYHTSFGAPLFSISIICTCGIVLYLLRRGYLIDLTQELMENLYNNNSSSTILFDEDKQFMNANTTAKNTFPENFLQEYSNFITDDKRISIEYDSSFYKCQSNHVKLQNGVSGYVVNAIDITDEQKTILQLTEQSSLFSIMSHKMRTPLNVIIGISDHILSTVDSSSTMKKDIKIIRSSGHTLLTYINSILNDEEDAPEEQNHTLETDDSQIKPTFTFSKAKVLLAEDMAVNQLVFEKLVSPWLFSVDIVENGEQAIEAVQNNDYQLVFLDKMMPVMDGIKTAEQIRSFSSVPMIIITADCSDDMQKTFKNFGFQDFISKPLILSDLKKIIETNMPFEYQDDFFDDEEDEIFIPEEDSNGIYRTYKDEITSISSSLEELFATDISEFRIKVHGIKSSSKQLGFLELGEMAEELEMAAKLENRDYINRHLARFLEECEQLVASI